MFGGFKVKPPKELASRLKDVAEKHDFETVEAITDHFVSKGLKVYQAPDDQPLKKQLDHVVDEQGYSSRDELIEHLLLRGLRAYEETAESPEELQQRLRGLGYIE